MTTNSLWRYLFVVIDRATRWVYIATKPNKDGGFHPRLPEALYKTCPIKITKLLTDNGEEFTVRLFGSKDRQATRSMSLTSIYQPIATLTIEEAR